MRKLAVDKLTANLVSYNNENYSLFDLPLNSGIVCAKEASPACTGIPIRLQPERWRRISHERRRLFHFIRPSSLRHHS